MYVGIFRWLKGMKVERVLIGNSLSLMNVYYRDTQTLKFTFNSLFIIIIITKSLQNPSFASPTGTWPVFDK